MRTSLKVKNLIPEGANSFLWYGKSLLIHKVTSLGCYYFYYARAYQKTKLVCDEQTMSKCSVSPAFRMRGHGVV